MNNHDFEMCCGTTCDKQADAEYVEELEVLVCKMRAAIVALLEDAEDGWSRDNGFEVLHEANRND